mgnify:CR=1 FL=1
MNNELKNNPLFSLGFRPFFLAGSFFSFIIMLLWLLIQFGYFYLPYSSIIWHSHEMIFGFTGAIITGFLLTAPANWAGIPGVRGNSLKILLSVWLAGRLLFPFCQNNFIFSIIDLSYFPLVIYFLMPYLGKIEQRKNQIFFIFLGLMFFGNLLVHLDISGIFPGWAMKGIYLGLNTIIMIIVTISGRVFPFFVKKAVKGSIVNSYKIIEISCIGVTGLFLIAELIKQNTLFSAIIAVFASLAHFIRLLGWRPWQTRKTPILWILFIGYLWLVIGFFLKSISYFFFLPSGISTHAWTTGVLGILIYGMITRVSLGHTGRVIEASRIIVIGYILLNLTVIIRAIIPLIMPAQYFNAIIVSGILWSAAYLIFILQYWKILTRPRVDIT